LLSFVESAPRAYRLKASNAAPPFFNIRRDIGVNNADIRSNGFVLIKRFVDQRRSVGHIGIL
jgi:hypothetical protein